MHNYTQAMLDELVACAKHIVVPPKPAMTSISGSARNGMKVAASGDRQFDVFMRISEKFEENFSIGLRYMPRDGSPIILVRCNGAHGNVIDPESSNPHFGYHIHFARETNIRKNRKPEAGGSLTNAYASYQQALRYFLKHCNITWSASDFPELARSESQMEMFTGD